MKKLIFLALMATALFPACRESEEKTALELKHKQDSIRLDSFIRADKETKAAELVKLEKQHIIDSVLAANKQKEKIVYVKAKPAKEITLPLQMNESTLAVTEEELGSEVVAVIALMKAKITSRPRWYISANDDSILLWKDRDFGKLGVAEYPDGHFLLQITSSLKGVWIVDENGNGFRNTGKENDSYGKPFYVKQGEEARAKARADYFQTIQSYKKKLQALPDLSRS